MCSRVGYARNDLLRAQLLKLIRQVNPLHFQINEFTFLIRENKTFIINNLYHLNEYNLTSMNRLTYEEEARGPVIEKGPAPMEVLSEFQKGLMNKYEVFDLNDPFLVEMEKIRQNDIENDRILEEAEAKRVAEAKREAFRSEFFEEGLPRSFRFQKLNLYIADYFKL